MNQMLVKDETMSKLIECTSMDMAIFRATNLFEESWITFLQRSLPFEINLVNHFCFNTECQINVTNIEQREKRRLKSNTLTHGVT